MAEHVSPLDLGVSWEPNAPDAVVISDDVGTTALAVRAHFEDADQRSVVLVWTGAESASMAAPNDEAISGHRLYDKGLRGLLGAGVVQQSELIKGLERQNSVHPAHEPAKYAHLVHPSCC